MQVCPKGFYRSSPIVWNCAGGHGEGTVLVAPRRNASVIQVPAGAEDFRIVVSEQGGGGNVHLSLLDLESMTYFADHPESGGVSAPIISGDSARIPGINQGPVDVTVSNSGFGDQTMQMSYSYGGISPCNVDEPKGCTRYYAEAAKQEVESWSCWAQERYENAGAAWAALVIPAARGASVEGVDWFQWSEVWKQWAEASSKLGWQQTFALLDGDRNEKVDFEEFKDGYFTCTLRKEGPQAAEHPSGAEDRTGWLFFGLLIFGLLGFLAYRTMAKQQSPPEEGYTGLEARSADPEKQDASFSPHSVTKLHAAPALEAEMAVEHVRHHAPAAAPAASFVALSPAPQEAVKVGHWEHGKPLPPRRKAGRGCDTCINPGEGGGWLECMGLRSTAVHTWACPCGTSHAETTPECSKCGAFRPSVVEHPVQMTQISKVAGPAGDPAAQKRAEPVNHGPPVHYQDHGSGRHHHGPPVHYQEHGSGRHHHGPSTNGHHTGHRTNVDTTSVMQSQTGNISQERLRHPDSHGPPLVPNGGYRPLDTHDLHRHQAPHDLHHQPFDTHQQHHQDQDDLDHDDDTYRRMDLQQETPRPADEIDATIQVMHRSAESASVQEDGCEFLRTAAGTEEGRRKVVMYGGIEAIISAMGRHLQSAPLQEHACSALVRFVTEVATGEDEVARLGGIEAIMQAMRKHPANERVQERACEALQQLSMTPMDRRRIMHGGGIELIEQAMQNHRECAGVQECSCLALGNLAFEAEGRELIARYGGLSAIIQALREHIHDVGVLEAACFVIHNMACTLEYTSKIKDLGGQQAIEEAQRVNVSLRDQEEAVAALEILMASH